MKKSIITFCLLIFTVLLSSMMVNSVLAANGRNNCYAGGPGANSCSISAEASVVEIGGSMECSVSCNSSYYACCSLKGCHCVKESMAII